jgi:hypothetical protein
MTMIYNSGEAVGEAPPAPGEPPRATGWSAAGNLIPGEGKEISLQQTFGKAETYVVQLSLERPNPQSPAVTVPRAEALISFSVAGNTTTRRISLNSGVSIAGNCESIVVRVIDVSAAAVFPDVIDETYRVRILVSKGSRASIGQPPTLIEGSNQTSLAAGASVSFVMRQDAGIVSCHVDVASTAGGTIPDNGVQVEQMTDTAATFILKQYDPRADTWVPMAPGCGVIRITNRTAALMRVRLTYGIDG